MKSVQLKEYGDTSNIFINEIEIPSPNSDQVLIEVYASSINPSDIKLMEGVMKPASHTVPPFTLGGDLAGIIKQTNTKDTSFNIGDKVYGQANVLGGNSGAIAEFAVTKLNQIAKMPSNLDFNQAASLPLVGVSALQAIIENINLKTEQKIFILGGAGGIGSVAIQLAKRIGAYVATTSSNQDINFVKGLGADQVIDYKSHDYLSLLKDYDAVFDTVGGEDFNKSLTILKIGGIAVSMNTQADQELANDLGITIISQFTKLSTERLNNLTKFVESGAVIPKVDKVFPMEEVADAIEAKENGRVKGKIVIQIK
ncbi:MAG TPA: NADP-dependent oxidoreductase [Patescibacteria group bacterium]|nr:NADP-dependent oxidoreductase [Patescibacteria group bacterium]